MSSIFPAFHDLAKNIEVKMVCGSLRKKIYFDSPLFPPDEKGNQIYTRRDLSVYPAHPLYDQIEQAEKIPLKRSKKGWIVTRDCSRGGYAKAQPIHPSFPTWERRNPDGARATA